MSAWVGWFAYKSEAKSGSVLLGMAWIGQTGLGQAEPKAWYSLIAVDAEGHLAQHGMAWLGMAWIRTYCMALGELCLAWWYKVSLDKKLILARVILVILWWVRLGRSACAKVVLKCVLNPNLA